MDEVEGERAATEDAAVEQEAAGATYTEHALAALRSGWPLVPDEQDQVQRLERFRTAHPEVVILLRGALPRAWAGGRKIECHTLRDLLDELEEIFPPHAQVSHAKSSQ